MITRIKAITNLAQDKRVEITPTSELEEFMSIMKDDRRTANIDPDILKLLFDRVSHILCSRPIDITLTKTSAARKANLEA